MATLTSLPPLPHSKPTRLSVSASALSSSGNDGSSSRAPHKRRRRIEGPRKSMEDSVQPIGGLGEISSLMLVSCFLRKSLTMK
ncbi:hypothetical protein RYX36_016350 [Vicia faba]